MLFPDLQDLIALKNKVTRLVLTGKLGSALMLAGDYTSMFHGLGMEFEAVRSYILGDDVRHIDWRVTARTGKTHVKTFRAETERPVLIVVDVNSYMRFGTRKTFKSIQAARTAALFAWYAAYNKDRIGSLLFGDIKSGIKYLPPVKTKKSIWQMLNLLCDIEINQHSNVPITEALDYLKKIVPNQCLLLVISDFAACDQQAGLTKLRKSLAALRKKCKLVLLPVSDPADKIIADVGLLKFEDLNGQQIIVNTTNKKSRLAYINKWQKYQDEFNSIARQMRLPVINLKTEEDIVASVLQGLQKC